MDQPTNKFQLTSFGEFLLRLHCSDNKRFLQAGNLIPYYGGAEANVCVLLSRLGISTNYISRIPANDITLAGIDQLKSHNVGTKDILYGDDKLGIYFTEHGNGIRATKVIYDRANSSYSLVKPGMIDWARHLKDTKFFHWSGIAAAVSQGATDVCAEALIKAKENGVIVSADFNYRATLWKYGKKAAETMPQLLAHSEIAVADLDSATVYYGIETDKNASFETRFKQCSEQLLKKIPHLKTLVMSFRTTQGIQHNYSGALMHHGNHYFSKEHALPFVTDQIGSGDAFTAGMLFGVINNYDPATIIEFATACGALKQSIAGDWAIFSKTEVEQFMQSGSSSRIVR